MSTFASSVVNKSGKKLAPKAPAQRRRAPVTAPTPPPAATAERLESADRDDGAPPAKRQRIIDPVTDDVAQESSDLTTPGDAASSTQARDGASQSQTAARATSRGEVATSNIPPHGSRSTLPDVHAPTTFSKTSSSAHTGRRGSAGEDAQSTAVTEEGPARTAHTIRSSPEREIVRDTQQSGPASLGTLTAQSPAATLPATTSDDGSQQLHVDPQRRSRRARSGTSNLASSPSANRREVSSFEFAQARDQPTEPAVEIATADAETVAGQLEESEATSDISVAAAGTADRTPTSTNADRGRGIAQSKTDVSKQRGSGRKGKAKSAVTSETPETAQGTNAPTPAAEAEDVQATPGAKEKQARKPRKPRAKKGATTTVSVSNAATPNNEQERSPDRGQSQEEQNRETTVSHTADEPVAADEESAPRKRQKRAATPDDAETFQIDPTKVTMHALTRDTRRGKKSKLESMMQEIDWEEVARKRKEAETRAYERGELERSEQEVNARLDKAGEQSAAATGPRTKIVNGQIVIDTASLVVDRHAAAAAEAANQPTEELEETDLTAHVTSHSWVHDSRRDPEERRILKMKSDPWSKEQTNEFYKALAMFGTDFFIISKMFPGKTRRQIKLKFVREERADPDRINAAVMGQEQTPMDITTYTEATGRTEGYYKDPQQLERELRDEEERQKEEIEKQREEQEQAQRDKQRRAAEKSAATQRERAAKRQASNKRKSRGGGIPQAPGPGAEGIEVAVEPAPAG